MASKRTDIDDSDVCFMYEVEGMTQQEIADYYGTCVSTIYWRLHPEKNRENSRKFRLENPEYGKEYKKEWNKQQYQEHCEEIKERVKKYKQTDKGKATIRKHTDNRRGLGSIEINIPFPNSEGHHIDTEHIIYIPAELHHSIYHNVHTGQGMEAINEIAFRYITEEMFDMLIAGEI